MNKVYISKFADNRIKAYLENAGYQVVLISPMADIDTAISCHPDIYICHLSKDRVFHGNPAKLTYHYPGHAIFNGCSTGKFFIHNLKITDAELLDAVDNYGLRKVHVAQGYAKCSCVVVDEDSIITADMGIAKAATKSGLQVLVIEPGQVVLEGYPYGFIGGASGKVGKTIVFSGNLEDHSDFLAIKDFIEERGLTIKYFKDYPLTDIGSIIFE